MALSWTLDKIGPLCRSAEDCGLVLHDIAGATADDPGSAGKSFYYAPAVRARFEGSSRRIRAGRFHRVGRPRGASRISPRRSKRSGPWACSWSKPSFPTSPTARAIGTIISSEACGDLRAAHSKWQRRPAGRSEADRRAEGRPGNSRQGLSEGHAHPQPDSRGLSRRLRDIDMLLAPARLGARAQNHATARSSAETTGPRPKSAASPH